MSGIDDGHDDGHERRWRPRMKESPEVINMSYLPPADPADLRWNQTIGLIEDQFARAVARQDRGGPYS